MCLHYVHRQLTILPRYPLNPWLELAQLALQLGLVLHAVDI